MLLGLYRVLFILLMPFLLCLIYYRIIIKKEDPKRYREKFGEASAKRENKCLIWFHVASVGEMKAVVPLLKKFSDEKYQLLVTSGTLTSSKIFETVDVKNAIHQFAPFDSPFVVRRFLDYWKPDLAIFIESEIWPNLIIESSKRFKLVLINAKMSDKSFNMWNKIPHIAKHIFSKFSYIVPASSKDHQKFQMFSANVEEDKLNLKYCSAPLSYDIDLLNQLKMAFVDKRILVCASTHPNEEELILNVYKIIKEKIPNFLLIIIPRHPNRGKEIYKLALNISLNVVLKSKEQQINKLCDIYIADALGELGTFYRLSSMAFVGASLIKSGGGHNIIEPAHLNCCILTGKYHLDFLDVIEDFKKEAAVIEVIDNKDLALKVISLFEDEDLLQRYASNAYKLVNKEYNLVDKIYNNLIPLIKSEKP